MAEVHSQPQADNSPSPGFLLAGEEKGEEPSTSPSKALLDEVVLQLRVSSIPYLYLPINSPSK